MLLQDAVIKKLKKYIEDPSYLPETVAKQSRAAMSLCMWTRAMDVYHRVAKVVEPKRQKLREAEEQLAEANRNLAEKQAALKAVEDRVDALRRQLAQAQQEQKDLNDQVGHEGSLSHTPRARARPHTHPPPSPPHTHNSHTRARTCRPT